MIYLTALKWIGLVGLCLGLVWGIYHLGLTAGNNKAKAYYEANKASELKDALNKEQSLNLEIIEQRSRINGLEKKHLKDTDALKSTHDKAVKELQAIIKESTDACLNETIPSDIIDRL